MKLGNEAHFIHARISTGKVFLTQHLTISLLLFVFNLGLCSHA